jgi:hypothetical protein
MATTPINPSWTYPQAGWATGQSQGGTDSFDTFRSEITTRQITGIAH